MNVAVSSVSPRRPIPRGRRWLFRIVTVVFAVGLLEAVAAVLWLTFPPLNREQFGRILDSVATLGSERGQELEVIHPYLGWVFNPEASAAVERHVGQMGVNDLGFVDSASAIRKKSDDRFVLGVLGGSVAQQVTTIGETALCDRLRTSPMLQGKTIEVVRLAMSGYKQPQQLMALNYVLALGGEFDAVVNIDGYNETGLVVGENDSHGVFAAYPRSWHVRLQDVVDPRNSSISYRLLGIRATRQSRAKWFQGSGLVRSNVASLLWAAQEAILNDKQVSLGLELVQAAKQRGFGFARQGPAPLYHNDSQMYDHITNLWKNSSWQLHHLCQGRGIPYVHCLQPNQYHLNSKPLSPRELKEYYCPDEGHAQAVTRAYPLLISAGSDLVSRGVAFHDLTQLFQDQTETIYSDYFCHYNAAGTRMLAEAVADRVVRAIAPAPPSSAGSANALP